MLNVDPLMRTILGGGVSVAGTWTPFSDLLGPNKITQSRSHYRGGALFCFVAATTQRVGSEAGSLPLLSPVLYPNRRMLVYNHTHYVYTHRPG
jgi:hypothetical protein